MSKIYKTVQGDSFDLIALLNYGHERHASFIIQANPDYGDVLIFEAGVTLNLPELPAPAKASTLPPWRRTT